MKDILIIDDDKSLCYSVKRTLESEYIVHTANDSGEAFEYLRSGNADLILLDYRLGEENGIDVLSRLKKTYKDIPVIMLTAFGTNDTVVKSISIGAADFLVKPVSRDELFNSVKKYVRSPVSCKNPVFIDYKGGGDDFIGSSSKVRDIMKLVATVAAADYPVLITGESGVGKELVAKMIHKYSKRGSGPLVALNCAAIPEQLLESELFGYMKGAFTGADKTKAGKLEAADGGTMVLDEIGDLPIELQAKLLRVLQDGMYEKLGDTKSVKADVRVVAITNKDLKRMVENGEFRGDLYWRLNVSDIRIPPLWERVEDIKPLTVYFIYGSALELGKEIECIESEAVEILKRHSWTGNVRELRNAVRKAVMLSSSKCLTVEDFKFLTESSDTITQTEPHATLDEAVSAVEKEAIRKALENNNGNQSATARELDITRVTLSQKMKKYNLS